MSVMLRKRLPKVFSLCLPAGIWLLCASSSGGGPSQPTSFLPFSSDGDLRVLLAEQTYFGLLLSHSQWNARKGKAVGAQFSQEWLDDSCSSEAGHLCTLPIAFKRSHPVGPPPPELPPNTDDRIEHVRVGRAVQGTLLLGSSKLPCVMRAYRTPTDGAIGVNETGWVFWSTRTSERWMIVSLSNSPLPLASGKSWTGAAMGDVDGDGVEDLALVEPGVCDDAPPGCSLYWLDVILSGTNLVEDKGRSLVKVEGSHQFHQVIGFDSWLPSEPRWSTTVEQGKVNVTATGPFGSYTFHARLQSGRLLVDNPL